MCGIAGLLRFDNVGICSDWLKKISDGMSARGPDDYGYMGLQDKSRLIATKIPTHIEGSTIALIHRRLAIVDLTETGWQPMRTFDGQYSIVFNGEIYNYKELRLELEAIGETFRTQSDTEVLLLSYKRWGAGALPRFIGMFAFAILDNRRQILFIARDSFGIKPLYYYNNNKVFGFASDTNLLLDFPFVSKRVNLERIYPYLRFGLTDYGGETFWDDIKQLPAAHYLEVPLTGCNSYKPVRYWSLNTSHNINISYEDATDVFRKILRKNIALHLRSDVPVGACLSGGVDSSSIVMLMREALGQQGDIRTFSHLVADRKIDEKKWIDVINDTAKAKCAAYAPTERDLMSNLDDLIRSQSEPFAGLSIYAQYRVFKLAASNNIKVILDGQGADEMLAGYWSSLPGRIATDISQLRLLSAAKVFMYGGIGSDTNYQSLAAATLGYFVSPTLRAQGRKIIGKELIPDWLNTNWIKDNVDTLDNPFHINGANYLRSQLECSVMKSTLPMLLRYEDRNSMRFSIESRVPFLTQELANFLFSLPNNYLINNKGTRKSILRSAMRGIVPDSILDRKNKIGFAAPDSRWLLSIAPWIEKTFDSEIARSVPVLNIDKIKKNWRRNDDINITPYVWRWVNLIEWTRQFGAKY